MTLSGAEIFLSLTIIAIGIIRNLKLYFNNAEIKNNIKWSINIYGSAIIIIICGLLTPTDILSNIIFSIPLTVLLILIINRIGYKNLKLKHENK